MKLDSMEMAAQRMESFLQRHKGNNSDSIRETRIQWLSAKGVIYMTAKARPDSALLFIEEALKELQDVKGKDKERLILMANQADCYRQLGQLDRSINSYMQGLEIAETTEQDKDTKVALLLGISTAYSFMGDYRNSGLWWQRTGELVDEMKEADQFIYYNNLGNDHYFQQHYREALDCFKKAIRIVEDNPDKQWDYYTALANLGEIHICLGQPQPAREAIERADSFFRKVNFTPALYYLETEKIELAMLEGRTGDALRMVDHCEFNEAYIPAAKMLRLKAVEQLMQKTGNSRRAYEIHHEYHDMNDSIQDANIMMQMSTKLLQYEHDKTLLEQQRTIDYERMTRRMAWSLLAVALLAIGLLVTLFIIHRRRQQVKEFIMHQQIVGMRMENTRQRISPHFVYNALNHEMLAQMEGRPVDLDALTQLLRRGADQTHDLETTLEQELTFVDYYINIEGRQMAGQFNYVKDIAPDVDCEAVRLPSMTIQIFVENAIKHGLQRKQGVLRISASRQQQATLIEVTDDGRGLSPDYQEHTGLKVVRQTIQMLNEHNKQQITFGVESLQPGCRSWILLPDDYNYKTVMI